MTSEDPVPATRRYAIYFAPPTDSALWAFGNDWLGRDAATGDVRQRPEISGFDAARLGAITRTAAGYGFHTTLKPPFALADGGTPEDLDAAAGAFAAARSAFDAPALELGSLDGFVALRLSAPSQALNRLAADGVSEFDAFRAPASAAELANRRRNGLTPAQERLLVEWGYPYVFEEWRFHMTLSCRLSDGERQSLMAALAPLTASHCVAPLTVDAICLFVQEDRSAPFRMLARYPFAGTAR